MANEKRLIDANEVIEKINCLCVDGNENWIGTDNQSFVDHADCIDIISDMPTVDAVEVVHGEWIYHECVSSYDGTISGYSCSKCSSFVNEEIFDMDEFHKDFCGHCGAKMDGGNEDENSKIH